MDIQIISRKQCLTMDCLEEVSYTLENQYFIKHERVCFVNKLSSDEELIESINWSESWRNVLPNHRVAQMLFDLDAKYLK